MWTTDIATTIPRRTTAVAEGVKTTEMELYSKLMTSIELAATKKFHQPHPSPNADHFNQTREEPVACKTYRFHPLLIFLGKVRITLQSMKQVRKLHGSVERLINYLFI